MKKCTSLDKKVFLNPEETIELFGISRRKFYRLIKEPQPFMANYKTRKLIIRVEFEEYLKQPGMREGLEKEKPSRPDYARRLEENGISEKTR